MRTQKLCELLSIKYPIIQAGMVYVSGGKLAGAAANTGVLGVLGAGSMKPPVLKDHILKAQSISPKGSLAVNVPLLYRDADQQLQTALDLGIRTFITSAGSPKTFTGFLKNEGAIVLHVTSSPLLAKKCEDAGVDVVIAEGFEAGGHNGRDETTTMVLIPEVVSAVKIPVVAAGGIGSGNQIAAALALGASGVQIGSRYAATVESSAHENFKKAMISAKSGDTELSMKSLVPVRLLKNRFYQEVKTAEQNGASRDELIALLGKGRARDGMLMGDMERGELEIGQVVSQIESIPTCAELLVTLLSTYKTSIQNIPTEL